MQNVIFIELTFKAERSKEAQTQNSLKVKSIFPVGAL